MIEAVVSGCWLFTRTYAVLLLLYLKVRSLQSIGC
jgi:hypothetical protein